MFRPIMRINRGATLLLAAGLLSVSNQITASPLVSLSQDSNGIMVLQAQQTTMKDVFNYLEKHSGYIFAYDNSVRGRLDDPVSVSINGRSVETVVSELCRTEGLRYTISGKQVLIKEERTKANSPAPSQNNQHQVKGRILDPKGEPLTGATVMVKGSTQGTVSDIDGNFTLNVPKGAVLVVSYVGFNPK